MTRWLLKADIAQTEVIENNNQKTSDYIEKNQSVDQQVSMKYDPQNTYEGQEETNKVNVELQKAAMRK